MIKITPQMLVPMDDIAGVPIRIHLAYAVDAPPNIFGKIYRTGARLWLHQNLADIVILAARLLHRERGLGLVLYDGLRTVEAQEAMRNSPIVRANPHWLEGPSRLLSPPGAGAHPRGMAIDLSLINAQGDALDMGTVFDALAENPDPEHNPAHRLHPRLSESAARNRRWLEDAMQRAAETLNHPLLPLPQEWWDFRFPPGVYEQYAPLSDSDLPPEMRMVKSL